MESTVIYCDVIPGCGKLKFARFSSDLINMHIGIMEKNYRKRLLNKNV
jgi:hypothetical protein